MRLPSGRQVNRIIFNNFEKIQTSRIEDVANLFSAIDTESKILGDYRSSIVESSNTLVK